MSLLLNLDSSWLNGKYKNGEINTYLSYVAVNEPEFFVQGQEADEIIEQINEIYNKGNLTTEQAFNKWINLYL